MYSPIIPNESINDPPTNQIDKIMLVQPETIFPWKYLIKE